jgi:hypothetical protein
MKKTIIALVIFAGLLLGAPLHAQTYAIDNPNVYSMTIPAPATYGVQYYDITGKPVFVPSVPLAANLFLASPSSGTGNASLRALVAADLPATGTNTLNGLTVTATTGTFTLAIAKTFTVNNSLTLAGTDGITTTLPALATHFYNNFATAGQAPSATVRTVITGTGLTFPAGALQVGTIIHWQFDMTKTGAGSATSTIDIAFGTAGTTSDTAQVSFTKPAGTAAIDEGTVIIEAVVKTNSASGVVLGNFTMTHNLAATGHMVIPVASVETTSGTFNTTTPTNIELCITTGASDAITINQASVYALNL